MNRLLIANFMRVKKNKLFWALCGVMSLVSLFMIVNAIVNNDSQIDNAMCMFVIPVEIAAAVFISIFFGTENSGKRIGTVGGVHVANSDFGLSGSCITYGRSR